MDTHIIKLIKQKDLDQRLEDETGKGKLEGAEHCFREALNWYRLNVGYTNPINYGEVHSELELIKEIFRAKDPPNRRIQESLWNRHMIFYGIGVGDTEIELINQAINNEQKQVVVSGIDVNRDFIDNFAIALQNRTYESDEPIINFTGYHALFEQIQKEDLIIPRWRNVHICLGGTIGNFKEQEKIIKLFSNLSEPGDTLILGFQLKSKIDWLFKKYQNNPLFPNFILNYIPPSEREEIQWNMNKKNGFITATHKGVEVFRSRKYFGADVYKMCEKVGFKHINHQWDKYSNSSIYACEKI